MLFRSFNFSTNAYTVGEVGPVAIITVIRSGNSNPVVTVNYSTSDGTARAGLDYTSVFGTLTFNATETVKTFNVPIIDDTIVESNETVNLTLSLPSGNAVLGAQSTAVLTIIDNDTSIDFTANAYSVNEAAGSINIPIRRLGLTNSAVSVSFTTSNGTATAGLDYTAVSQVVNFAAGVTQQLVNIPITNDTLPEGDESVFLVLTNATGGATLGTNNLATLTIVDNDIAIQLSAATYSVAEDSTNAIITLIRSGQTNASVGVTFATVNGTATAGVDFSGVNSNVTFAAGVTTVNIAVPIIDNFTAQNNRTATLRITNATGGAFLLAPTNAVLRIVDNDRVGSLDSLFGALVGADGTVNALVVQPDGKVIIGGNFTTYEGTTINRIARVNVDGTLDATFNPGVGFDNIVYALALQPDGKVVVEIGRAHV